MGEAASAATGDIPDNQVFLTFTDPTAGYSLKYPEGWAQRGRGAQVTFSDKNNVIRLVIVPAGKPTLHEAATGLGRGATTRVSAPARALIVGGKPAVKLSYRTVSAPNPVTGKRVTLVVDRYYFWHRGKRAILDLGTAVGVDNVDAYRLISESFRWR